MQKQIKKGIFLLLVVLMICCKNQQNNDNAEQYLHKIEIIHDEITDAVYSIDSLINSYNFTQQTYEKKYNQFIKVYQKSKKTTTAMKSFAGDKKLAKALLEYIETIAEVVDNQYAKLAKLYQKPFDQWTEVDFDNKYKLLEDIDNTIFEKEMNYQQRHQQFVDKYMLE